MNVTEQYLPLNIEEENTEKQLTHVICLGREFESDEARREYYREELRRRLPELRQIEGFPIGEDEDIIRLSDPPYYTACPNPWLNDFIAEWEREKEQLLKEGKRTADFEVKEPYASDVSEGKNNPIYMAHAYHTKVPHPAIMRYILHYTQPGDIVFDGFCGTGMTGVAANLCDSMEEISQLNMIKPTVGYRHSICSDLSPIASFITSNFNLPFDGIEFKKDAECIIERLESRWNSLYETHHKDDAKGRIIYTIWSELYICPSCGHEIPFAQVSDDLKLIIPNTMLCNQCRYSFSKKEAAKLYETVFVDGETIEQNKLVPILIRYEYNGKQYFKKPDEKDFTNIERIHSDYDTDAVAKLKIPQGVKTSELIRNGRLYASDLYTKRNLIIFNELWKETENHPLIRFAITSILVKTGSLLHNVGIKDGKINLAGALPNALFIPSVIAERNVFELLKGKINDIAKVCISQNSRNINQIGSAVSLNTIKSESIDYIFVDPPFGSNLMYSELNFIHEAWLRILTDSKTEAIENKAQNKTLTSYMDLMLSSFKEFYRILKQGKWVTVEFSNTSASVWNAIQYAITHAGFVIANVSALDKQQGSYNSQTTSTAVKQDLVITCYKPTTALTEKMERSGDTAENVWDFAGELLEHLPVHLVKENKTTAIVERSAKILFDRMIAYYVQHGYPVPMDAQEFQAGLRDRFVQRDGMFFTAEQAMEYDEKKREAPEFQELALFVDSEQNGISWLRNELRDAPQTYQDLQPKWMQALQSGKKGDAMPELRDILQENFIEEDGIWRLPDPEKEADLDKLRTRKLLREFAHYAEQARLPRSKKMKDARLEALRAGFKQCYKDKDFQTILLVGDKIPESLLTEDDVLLQYYDIAASRT